VTGVVAALAGITATSAASGVVIPSPTPVWTAIFGYDAASTNNQTLAGITAPISLSASLSGAGALLYVKNGVATLYTGAFSAVVGDVIAWTVLAGLSTVSGTLTVTNASDAGATLATIGYVVKSSGGGGGRGDLP
jgi:hypothetical protein